MTTDEVRSSVLDSATAEGRAREYSNAQEQRVLARHSQGESEPPLMLLQAIPLARPSTRWNLETPEFYEVVRGRARARRQDFIETWSSDVSPTPTLEGLLGREVRDEPKWESEIHRNGYLHVWTSNYWHARTTEPLRYGISPNNESARIEAFASLLEECWRVANEDLPYLLRYTAFRMLGTVLHLAEGTWEKWSEPCNRSELRFDEVVRQPGVAPSELVTMWIDQLHHAFHVQRATVPS